MAKNLDLDSGRVALCQPEVNTLLGMQSALADPSIPVRQNCGLTLVELSTTADGVESLVGAEYIDVLVQRCEAEGDAAVLTHMFNVLTRCAQAHGAAVRSR